MVATSSGGTEMSLNLDAVEGKSHQPERFGFILRLWSLFFAAKGTTDLHTGVGVWVGVCVCVCVCVGGVAVSWMRVGRSCNSD